MQENVASLNFVQVCRQFEQKINFGGDFLAVRKNLWLPDAVAIALKLRASTERVSQSAVVTSSLMAYLGITQDAIDKQRGFQLPLKANERIGDWSPNKKQKGV